MRAFVTILSFATILCLAAVATHAADSRNPSGLWANDKSMLRISVHGETLRAEVVALKNPTYTADEEASWPVGSERRDDNNPDANLRARPVLGIDLLKGFVWDDGKWRGELYDPESGNWYSAHITVSRKGVLRMRGYIGTPLLGRTAEFVPATSCTEDVKAMTAGTNLVSC